MALLATAGPASAGSAVAAPAAQLPAFSLDVSPTRFVLGGSDLGQTKTFDVSNRGRQTLDVTVTASGFTSSPTGAMVLQPTAPYSAVNWVSVSPTKFHLTTGQHQLVKFRMTLPSGPEPGDHQLAMIFLVPAGRNGANIKLNRGIGTPVYVTVPGKVVRSVHVTSLSAPGFALRGPVGVNATVVDAGNVHQDFRGSGALTVQVAGKNHPFADFTVLRDSTRQVSMRWNPPLFCICHARVTLSGPGGVSERSVRIVVIPIDLIAYVLAGIMLLIALFFVGRRRYRAHIAAAASRLNE